MADSPHKSEDEIMEEINAAAKLIEIGATYAHYKDRAKTYKPLSFATLEVNNDLCVIYRAEYGKKLVFARPVNVWLDELEYNGERVKRFTKI